MAMVMVMLGQWSSEQYGSQSPRMALNALAAVNSNNHSVEDHRRQFGMSYSAVSAAAKQISELLVDEAKYLYAVKGKVAVLRDELTWMRSFLQDADSREQDEELLRLWVSQIRDFAYEAEDIVEKYLHRVTRHRQEGVWNTVQWFSCICFDAIAHHEIGSDLDELKQKISDLCSRMQIYGVKNKSTGNPRLRGVAELKRSNSKLQREEIVGLRRADELVSKLVGSDHKVICVSGMGGLGKTTLAKMVYAEVKSDFHVQAWIYVSQQFQTANVFRAILLKLGYINDSNNEVRDEELPSKICQVLLEKKCLVVLDDIWNDEDWRKLAPAFATLHRSQSRLLITTRKETLLSRVDNGVYHHRAQKLSNEESWQLLKMRASRGNAILDEDMERLGKEMSDKCDGLPLALVVLGGILAAKTGFAEWEKVKDNFDSFLKNSTTNQDTLSILQVLELSYYNLPYHLKPCFLHLANFPEDYEIPTKSLYYMWAVEGLVAQPTYSILPEEQKSLEAVANDHLQELVDRCLVEVCRRGKKGEIKSCRLHDLIREMCLRKSNEENFLHVVEHGDLNIRQSRNSSLSHANHALRRLAIYLHKSGRGLKDLISADHNTGHVRSLLLFPVGESQRKFEWPKGTLSKYLKLVRVLSFEDICIRSVPSEIGELIHLRYLSLKGTRVSELPQSIGKLKYLEILDLQVSESIDVRMPNVIWKLQKLKHLYLPNNWEVVEDVMHTVVAEAIGAKITTKLRLAGLSQLETLVNLRLKDCHVKDMLELKALQEVTLSDYPMTENECLKSFLKCPNIAQGKLKKPLSLVIGGSLLSKDPSILASSNSPICFHKLEISGKIRIGLDYARIFPRGLKKLSLNQCELQDDPMPVLEKLHHLEELTLGEKSFSGNKMVCSSENFPKLVVLRLVQLENLDDWRVQRGAMPDLRSLYVYSCQKLVEIPSELPEGVKVGCRPCIRRDDKYGVCYYNNTHHEIEETGA